MNQEIVRFIELAGGANNARQILKCSPSQLYKMRVGDRAVTPHRAKVIIKAFPELSFYSLLLPNT